MKYFLFLLAISGYSLAAGNTNIGYSTSTVLDTVDPALSAPQLSEVILATGSTAIITWIAVDTHPQTLPIQLDWRDSPQSSWAVIAAFECNDGSYSWIIPDAYTNQAQVRITMTDSFGNFSANLSEYFGVLSGSYYSNSSLTCLDTADPVIDISSPMADSVYAWGELINISWTLSETNQEEAEIAISWRSDPGTIGNRLPAGLPPTVHMFGSLRV
jgi:hypothetical protein